MQIGDIELDFWINETKFKSPPYDQWTRFDNIPEKVSIGGSPSEVRIMFQYLRRVKADPVPYEPDFKEDSISEDDVKISVPDDGSEGLGPGTFSMNITAVASLGNISDSRDVSLTLQVEVGHAHPDTSRLVLNEHTVVANRLFKMIIVLRDEFGFGPAQTRLDDETRITFYPEDTENQGETMAKIIDRSVNNAGDTVLTVLPLRVGTVVIGAEINVRPEGFDKDFRRIQGSHEESVTFVAADCADVRETMWEDTRCECSQGFAIDSVLQDRFEEKYNGVEISDSEHIDSSVLPIAYYTEKSGGPSDDLQLSACVPCAPASFSDAVSNTRGCQECVGESFSGPRSTECFDCPDFGPECTNGLALLRKDTWCESCNKGTSLDEAFEETISADMLSEVKANSSRLLDARVSRSNNVPRIDGDTVFHACLVRDSCLLTSEDRTAVACREGHREDSRACAVCEPGWARWTVTMSMHCERCWDAAANYVTVIIMIAGIIAFVLFVYDRIRFWNIFSQIEENVQTIEVGGDTEKLQQELNKDIALSNERLRHLIEEYHSFRGMLCCHNRASRYQAPDKQLRPSNVLNSPISTDTQQVREARAILDQYRGMQHPSVGIAVLRIFVHWIHTLGILTMARLVPGRNLVYFTSFLVEMFNGLPISMRPFTCIADSSSTTDGSGLFSNLTGRLVTHAVGSVVVILLVCALVLALRMTMRVKENRSGPMAQALASIMTVVGVGIFVFAFPLTRSGASFLSSEPTAFREGNALSYDYRMTTNSPSYGFGLGLGIVLFLAGGVLYPMLAVRQLWKARQEYHNSAQNIAARRRRKQRYERTQQRLTAGGLSESEAQKEAERSIEGETSKELTRQPLMSYTHAFLAAGYIWNSSVVEGEGEKLQDWARSITSEEGATRHGGWWMSQVYEVIIALRKVVILLLVIAIPGLIEQATSGYIAMMAFLCVHLTLRPYGSGSGAGSGVSNSYLDRRRYLDLHFGAGSRYSSSLTVSGTLNNLETFALSSILVVQVSGILMYDSDFIPESEPPSTLAAALQILGIIFTVIFMFVTGTIFIVSLSFAAEKRVRNGAVYLGGRRIGLRSVRDIETILKKFEDGDSKAVDESSGQEKGIFEQSTSDASGVFGGERKRSVSMTKNKEDKEGKEVSEEKSPAVLKRGDSKSKTEKSK